MRAGLVEATWTSRVIGSRRLTTPSEKRRGIRVSTSTQPGDARSNDSAPARLSSTSMELSSEETVASQPPASPSQSASLSASVRSGGLIT